MRGDDVNVEREAARADLRRLFGDDFGTKVTILTMSQYRGEWPVNRAMQGEDVSPATGVAGLYLVGDAVKPSGYLMVEGVAQSVNALLDTLDTWIRWIRSMGRRIRRHTRPIRRRSRRNGAPSAGWSRRRHPTPARSIAALCHPHRLLAR